MPTAVRFYCRIVRPAVRRADRRQHFAKCPLASVDRNAFANIFGCRMTTYPPVWLTGGYRLKIAAKNM